MIPEPATAIARAEDLLRQRNQIASAITAAETAEPAAVQARLNAESKLAEVESACALGEADPKVLSAARKNLTAAQEELDGLNARIRGLKARAEKQTADLIAARDSLQTVLPAHRQAAAESFRPEWEAAIAAFGKVLGKRARLESIFGTRFELADPAPAETDEVIGDDKLARPGQLLADLQRAISWSQSEKLTAVRLSKKRQPFDPNAVYVLRRSWGSWREGTKVTGSMLGAGGQFLFETNMLLPLREATSSA
jgi:hypothetical protein